MAGKNTSRKGSTTRRASSRKASSTKTSSKRSFNFVSNFRSAVNRGTPAPVAVWNLAQKTGKTPNWVWSHLFTNKAVNRRKFNGSWIYWPSFQNKNQSSKNFANDFWQQVASWAIASGFCTPEQIAGLKSQKDFVNFFGPFFAQNCNWTVNSGWTMSQVKSFGQKKTTKSKAKAKAKAKAKSRAKSTRKSRSAAKKSRTTRAKRQTATTRVKRATKRTSVKRNTKTTAVKRSTKKNSAKRPTVKRNRTVKARKPQVAKTFKFPTTRTRSLRKAA